MRLLLTIAALGLIFLGVPGANTAQAANICPTTANTNTDCGFVITIAADGTVTGAAVANANPYDGSDDALVGVINNETSAFTGSIVLSGTGNGGGLFGFDGDGICTYTSAAYCNAATSSTGYEGPNNTFTNISPDTTTGTVLFNVAGGIAAGGTSFFSLEGSPASISTGGGIGVGGTTTTSTPEPASLAIIGAGLVGLMAARRKRV